MQGISFTRIDSSLAFGFYVRNEEEFEVYLLFGNIGFKIGLLECKISLKLISLIFYNQNHIII